MSVWSFPQASVFGATSVGMASRFGEEDRRLAIAGFMRDPGD